MARMYESGQGVARNLVLARHWTERAAHGGNVRAMHDMGVYLARGEGASLDAAGAFRWFRAAADYGVADSQYNLGVLYAQGRGVNADAKEALFWFLVAGRHGDTNAVDRAVEMATHLSEADVDAIRDRARAFDTQPPNEEANPGNDASSGA
jgi:localization factor PodJL